MLVERPSSRYKTIIFDAGGTLVGFSDPTPFLKFLAQLPPKQQYAPTRQDALRLMRRVELEHKYAEAIAYQRNQAPDTTGRLWRSVFLKVWSGSETVAGAMFDWFLRGEFDTLYDDVLPTLQMLSVKSIQIGVLSNFAATLEDRFRKLGIYNYFDFFVVSSVVGLTKPDPAIFDLAVNRAGCEREYILYVADKMFDIKGARQVGMSAILIDRHNCHPMADCTRLLSLTDVEKLL